MKRLKKPNNPHHETLDRFTRWPALKAHWVGREVRIWSGEHEAYWREGGHGYTTDGLHAGLFRFEDAFNRTMGAGSEKRIEFRLV